MILLPVATMAFLKDTLSRTLESLGVQKGMGAAYVVPGMAVLFAFFLVASVGVVFFREHLDNTWDRLRAQARPKEILIGKLLLPLLTFLYQQVAVFALGAGLYGLPVRPALFALALVMAAFVVCLTTLGFAIMAICRTQLQLDTANQVLLGSAGVAGALVPVATLPGWAQAVAPLTPGYWAMKGYLRVSSGIGGLQDVIAPVGVLLLFACVFGVTGKLRFRFEEVKSA